MGEFDVPAMIDKIRYKTGANKIFFAAFSMGTTSYMVMANRRPEYLNYVEFASFLAPVAYVDHMTSPMRYIAPFTGQIDVSEYILLHIYFKSFLFKYKVSTGLSIQTPYQFPLSINSYEVFLW